MPQGDIIAKSLEASEKKTKNQKYQSYFVDNKSSHSSSSCNSNLEGVLTLVLWSTELILISWSLGKTFLDWIFLQIYQWSGAQNFANIQIILKYVAIANNLF